MGRLAGRWERWSKRGGICRLLLSGLKIFREKPEKGGTRVKKWIIFGNKIEIYVAENFDTRHSFSFNNTHKQTSIEFVCAGDEWKNMRGRRGEVSENDVICWVKKVN